MLAKCLVALDGSRHAERSVEWLRHMSPNAEIAFLHVIEPPTVVPAAILIDPKEYLRKVAERWGGQTTLFIREGHAAHTILDIAEGMGADLIAVAAHGERPGLYPLGRVTEKLLHHSGIPLFVTPIEGGVDPRRIKKIVVPLDGSTLAERAVALAASVARMAEAEMLLVHIMESPIGEWWSAESRDEGRHSYSQALEQALVRREEELHRRLRAKADELGGSEVQARFIIRRGSFPEAALTLARAEEADLIVMSAHGYGALQRWMIGSSTSKLIRSSPVPVLVMTEQAPREARTPETTAKAEV
jgi:nucleotide-binding universal stress UspA family protein